MNTEQLIHMCCHCGQIANAQGQWGNPPPVLNLHRNDHNITHGICGRCLTRFYPEYFSVSLKAPSAQRLV